MKRIDELFKKKKDKILNMYCTAGFPHLEDTLKHCRKTVQIS